MYGVHVSLEISTEIEVFLAQQANEPPGVLAIDMFSLLTGGAEPQVAFGTSKWRNAI